MSPSMRACGLALGLSLSFQGVSSSDTIPFPPAVDARLVFGNDFDPLPMLVNASSAPLLGEVHYFFHVPKAAGTSLVSILRAHNMITLPAGDLEDLAYLERTKVLQRRIITYLKTPMFYDACAMLGRAHLKARAFTILREPVGRIVSLFWYKKDSVWEKHFDPGHANKTMDEFLKVSTFSGSRSSYT